MARRKPGKTISETLRDSITDSGLSFKELERRTGVLRQTLMKFVRGEQTINLVAADAIATYFDIILSKGRDMDLYQVDCGKRADEILKAAKTGIPEPVPMGDFTVFGWYRDAGNPTKQIAEFRRQLTDCDVRTKCSPELRNNKAKGAFAIAIILDVPCTDVWKPMLTAMWKKSIRAE